MSTTKVAAERQRRPVGVWIICAVYALAGAHVLDRKIAIDVFMVAAVVGVVLLFMLRRQAFLFMLAPCVVSVSQFLYLVMAKHWLASTPPYSVMGAVVGKVIGVGVVVYVYSLKRKGVLV